MLGTHLLRSAFLAFALAAIPTSARPQSVPGRSARPNVIILLTDDQGYGDLSAHGNPVLRTPHLDQLRSESVRLTDFHVAPVCTPTRGQLMTGVDALRNGATAVTAGHSMIRPGYPTMAEIFQAGGYRTAMFGKWHLGDSYPNLPHNRGFDEAVYLAGWGVMSVAEPWLNDNFDDFYHHNGKLEQYRGYCTDIWFDLSLNWMKERREQGEPFFLYLPTNAPHHPAWVPDKYRKIYAGKGPAGFFGMIANLDENIGRLEGFLRQSGLYDDTIVIFMNDNGGTAGVDTFNAGMRDRKASYYDGGHRAMCFVRWPKGGLRQAGDVDALTQVQDLLPTLIDLTGLRKPEAARFDGVSLAPLLRGESDDLPDRTLVVQYGQTPARSEAAVMWKKWRLVHGNELYDLTTDPGQVRDVAEKHPAIAAQMRASYDRWWAGVEPRVDAVVPIVLGASQQNPVTLTSVNWTNVCCDNVVNCLRPGENRNAPWAVAVAIKGRYEFALRRWPKDADLAITAGAPAVKLTDGDYPAGKALPITTARLKIGDFDQALPVGAADHSVVFSIPLETAACVQMQTWFLDEHGEQLCGAYYVEVRRL